MDVIERNIARVWTSVRQAKKNEERGGTLLRRRRREEKRRMEKKCKKGNIKKIVDEER